MSRLFCFGLGYTARFLAAALRGEGWEIAGTTRAGGAAAVFDGVAALPFTRGHPLAAARLALASATHVLLSVPPDDAGDAVLDAHGADLAAAANLRWIGYLSTTGVYGDRQGGWVDEGSPLRPSGARGLRRAAAEEGWLALHHDRELPVHVFRLAGIYGPGRSALDALRQGRAQRIDKPGQIFSRIHIADLVAVLRASMARPSPGRIYNVCDDDPVPPADVVAFAASLLGMEPPLLVPFAEAALSPMARSFYADSKRVSNRRIKEELGVRLLYPSYRDGLTALFRGEAQPSSDPSVRSSRAKSESRDSR